LTGSEQDRNPLRSLLISVFAGGVIFVGGLFLVQVFLEHYAGGAGIDSSFAEFYPLMAVLGAMWGFSRWWSYEQGEYNPFHSH